MKDNKEITLSSAKPLLFAVGMIAICGIIYELIIGSISSYLLGDSVKQYSLTIGVFMSSMGVGSYLTRYFRKKLFDYFVMIELIIGIVGGISAVTLFYAYGYSDIYILVMYCMIVVIGLLVGLEIPLLTRIIEENDQNLRTTIANVLCVDYIGALFGSIAFPLLLLPSIGEIRTSFLIGLINAIVALMIILCYKRFIYYKNTLLIITLVAITILTAGVIQGENIGKSIEDKLYRDQIIYNHQSLYQKIVMTKYKEDIRLFLNGNIQFSSLDEYRYHEALVHPAMTIPTQVQSVLVLGGGDGLAVREILKYDQVKSIDLVDLDPAITKLAIKNELLLKLNEHSLLNNKVNVMNQDAFSYLENSTSLYDVVIIDLPDPNNESLNKLYTNVFYRLVSNHLSDDGIMVIQSTSPLHAKDSYWCIQKTVASENFYVDGYHINVPSFGEWGFTIASKTAFDINFDFEDIPLQFLNEVYAKAMFDFPVDLTTDLEKIEVNQLTHPVLIRYYQDAWRNM
jgi:spermidine synthase